MTGTPKTPTISTRDKHDKRQAARLSVTKIAGSGLAAITAAVAASYLGVAGTVIGAAVMSVATTVGTDVYTHYLRRTGNKVRQHTTTVRRRRPADPEPPAGPSRRLGWIRAGAAVALVLTIGFGGVLIFQVLAGRTAEDRAEATKAEPRKRHGAKVRRDEPAEHQRVRSDVPPPSRPRPASPSPTPSPSGKPAAPAPALSGTASIVPAPTPTPPATTTPEPPPATVTPSEQPTAPASPLPETSRWEDG
ncbi:hypothetical protein [Nonomuraea insulae]|uniref:Uncharacterized protein n=1 Tax=Nonomuraea insulae TaxID=1616787 RepID=A0ABW1CKP1_9ACTN